MARWAGFYGRQGHGGAQLAPAGGEEVRGDAAKELSVRARLIHSEDKKGVAGGDKHVLFALVHVGDGIGVDSAAGFEAPEQIALLGVERKKGGGVAAEH